MHYLEIFPSVDLVRFWIKSVLVCPWHWKPHSTEGICSEVRGFPGGSAVKNPSATQERQIPSLGWENPLEKKMATHSNILAGEIPWTEEPGGLQSMVSRKSRTQFSDCNSKQQKGLVQGPKHGDGRQASDPLQLGLWVGDVLKGENKASGVSHRLLTFLWHLLIVISGDRMSQFTILWPGGPWLWRFWAHLDLER